MRHLIRLEEAGQEPVEKRDMRDGLKCAEFMPAVVIMLQIDQRELSISASCGSVQRQE